jgi:hypothetical protein
MLVTLADAAGASHIVTWQGQDQINDASGSLQAGAVGNNAVPQQVLAANVLRAGWLFQNTSQHAMLLLELSGSAITSSWVINSGGFFPPPGYPIPTGIIEVQGTADSQLGDSFAAREWVNAVGE